MDSELVRSLPDLFSCTHRTLRKDIPEAFTMGNHLDHFHLSLTVLKA
jgi:hypothetical protein